MREGHTMTTTMNRQARIDQLNAELEELELQEKRDAFRIELEALADTVSTMLVALNAGNVETVRARYDGSNDGTFWGPINRIKKQIAKLK
jgi:hypothetical protein